MRTAIYSILAVCILAVAVVVRPPPFVFGRRHYWAPTGRAVTQISVFKTALSAYQIGCGHYPAGPNGLADLVQKPSGETSWHGPYLDSIPKDPWGNDYIYQCPGRNNTNSFDLMSMGPDGHRGTEDDITNWQIKK